MASRRCISEMIYLDDFFLEQSIEAQHLYTVLNLSADNMGFVNGYRKILRMIGIDEKYLDELSENGWIYKFDKAILIKDWWIHNNKRNIQGELKTLSEYINNVELVDNVYRLKSSQTVDFPTQTAISQDTDNNQSSSSLGKVPNINKYNINQSNINQNNLIQVDKLNEADMLMLEDVFKSICSCFPSQKINYHVDLDLFINEVVLHHEDASLNDYANSVKSAIYLYLRDLKTNNTEVRFYSRLCNLFLEESNRGKLETYLLKVNSSSQCPSNDWIDDTLYMDLEDIQNYVTDEDLKRYEIPELDDICQVICSKYKEAFGIVRYVPITYLKIIVGLTHCERKKVNDLAYAIDLFASYKKHNHNCKSCELAYFLVYEAKNYLEMSGNDEEWVRDTNRVELLNESYA